MRVGFRRFAAGLTLVELTIAIGIVALAILALVLLFSRGIVLMRQADDVGRATEVARRLMESIRQRGHPGVPATASVFDGSLPDAVDPSLDFPPAPYPRVNHGGSEYVIKVFCEPEGDILKYVRVEVWWDENSKVAVETSLHP